MSDTPIIENAKSGTIGILLVEDDDACALLLQKMLSNRRYGSFSIRRAGNLSAALREVAEAGVDLVLLDLGLPDSQGMETFVRMRAAEARTPIIVLSGLDDEALATETVQKGAQDYVVKGHVDGATLARTIRYAIERCRAQQALAEEHDLLRSVIDNIPDQVYLKDRDSRFVSVNPVTARFFGADSPDQIVGKCDFDFFPRELAAQFLAEELSLLNRDQKCVNREATITDAAGNRQWVWTTKVPLRDHTGKVTGLLGINRDITEHKKIEEAIRRLNTELEQRVLERTAKLQVANDALQKEIAHRKKTEAELRETEERYQAFFDRAADSIVIFDAATGTLVEFNDKTCENLGYTREEFEVLRISDFDAIESADDTTRHVHRIVKEGADVFETRHRTKTGEIRDVVVNARRISIREKPYILSIWHDITRRKRVEEELLKAMVRLEEHDLARTEFVANVSHELRTPLVSMKYEVENLLEGVVGSVPDRVREYLRLLNKDCQRMCKTVEDILDLSRLESKTMRLNRARLLLDRLIRRGMAALKAQAEAKNIEMALLVDPGLGFVECDAFKMERVIINIIGNAIKFTPSGGTVQIVLRRETTDPGMLFVEVADTGIGIAPEHIEKVTEKYFRIGEHVSGTGLGLSIAKEIVELHGGRLIIQSPPPGQERGTLVSIAMPTAEPPTILVVDDNQAIKELIARQMRSYGYRVATCGNGEEALEGLRRAIPDVVILDLFMPIMDGEEVILRIKSEETLRGIPILVLTGGELDRTKQAILDEFGIPAMSKPWTEEELLDRIEEVIMGSSIVRGDERLKTERRRNPA